MNTNVKILWSVCCHSIEASAPYPVETGQYNPFEAGSSGYGNNTATPISDPVQPHTIFPGFCRDCEDAFAPLHLAQSQTILSYWCFKSQLGCDDPISGDDVPLAELLQDDCYLEKMAHKVDSLETIALAREVQGSYRYKSKTEELRAIELFRYVERMKTETLRLTSPSGSSSWSFPSSPSSSNPSPSPDFGTESWSSSSAHSPMSMANGCVEFRNNYQCDRPTLARLEGKVDTPIRPMPQWWPGYAKLAWAKTFSLDLPSLETAGEAQEEDEGYFSNSSQSSRRSTVIRVAQKDAKMTPVIDFSTSPSLQLWFDDDRDMDDDDADDDGASTVSSPTSTIISSYGSPISSRASIASFCSTASDSKLFVMEELVNGEIDFKEVKPWSGSSGQCSGQAGAVLSFMRPGELVC
jgi:hypothetical protein